MLHTPSEIDANFYRLIHQMVGPQLKDEPAERRRGLRHPFRVVQRIAPRRGPQFPEDHEFVEVRCYDLTRAGFSFFFPIRPDFKTLVAAFGTPPQWIYVGAEVARCDSVLVRSSGEVEHIDDQADHAHGQDSRGDPASPMILVACRFVERLAKPPGRMS
jgi:hypothetical protein